MIVLYKMARVRKSYIVLFCVFLVAYLATYRSRNPVQASSWEIDFPAERIETPYFMMFKKAGWISSLHNNFEEEKKPFLLWLSRGTDKETDSDTDIEEGGQVSIFFSRNYTERDWLTKVASYILFDLGAQKVNEGKGREFYRYEGYLKVEPKEKGKVAYIKSTKKCSYIAMYLEPGLWIVFWGYQEYENDFWEMVDSIKLKLPYPMTTTTGDPNDGWPLQDSK